MTNHPVSEMTEEELAAFAQELQGPVREMGEEARKIWGALYDLQSDLLDGIERAMRDHCWSQEQVALGIKAVFVDIEDAWVDYMDDGDSEPWVGLGEN